MQVTPQTPLVQNGDPLEPLQTVEQPPQCVASSRMLVSHPFAALPSQFAVVGAQVMPQTPLLQDAVPPVVEQTWVQAPQWVGLVSRLTSQPLDGLPSQSA